MDEEKNNSEKKQPINGYTLVACRICGELWNIPTKDLPYITLPWECNTCARKMKGVFRG